MDSSPVSRKPGLAAVFLQRLRAVPWLTAAVFLCGAMIAAGLAVREWRGASGSLAGGGGFLESIQDPDKRDEWVALVRRIWSSTAWCLLPAAVLAALRLRGRRLIVPVGIASLLVTLYWLGTDLAVNLHRSLNDPLGMEPSPAAYTAKLVLVCSFLLSPPLLVWLYYRSTLLDRYLLRGFLGPFLMCLCGITGLMVIMDLLQNAGDFAGYGLGGVVMYYLGQMPRILVAITEAALLLATLFALGKMSRHNELTAMNSAGRSVLRMLMPLLAFGFWTSLAMLSMNYQLAPEATRVKEETRRNNGGKAARETAVYNVFYRNREGSRTWYIHSVPYDLSEEHPMSDVYIWQQNEAGELLESHHARKGVWIPGTGVWRLYDVASFAFADPVTGQRRDQPRRTELAFLEQKAWRESPGGMLSDKLDAEFLGVPSLLSCLKARATLPDKAIARYETALQWRFALPFRCFLIVLLAAPLGIVASRRNMMGGVSSALGVFIAVFFLSTMFLKSGEGRYLPPWAAAWGMNILFAITGSILFWYRSRNRLPLSLNPLNWFRRPA